MKRVQAILMAMVLVLSVTAAGLAFAAMDAQARGANGDGAADAPGFKTAAPDDDSRPPAVAIDLTQLMQAIVSLAVTLITAFVIPWIRARYSFEQRQRIAAVYQTIVYAAEQMFGAGMGEKKLEWAVQQLEAKGFVVDRAAIEAEVRKMQSLGAAILARDGTDERKL